MSSAVKRAVIGFCVAFGNMFFAHGLFFVFAAIVVLINIEELQMLTIALLYALQLALNIVLYFMVLKKKFQPVKEREPLFYFLFTLTAGAIWTGALFIFARLFVNDVIDFNLWDNYPETLLGLLPLIAMFTIMFSVIYYTLFRKRVGELYHFYTLGIMLIGTVPIVFLLTFPLD